MVRLRGGGWRPRAAKGDEGGEGEGVGAGAAGAAEGAIEEHGPEGPEGWELPLLGDVVLGVGHVASVPPAAGGAAHGGTARGVDRRGAARVAGEEETAVVRVVAEHQEDLYRVLHRCLSPLAPALGGAPYADRLHARTTVLVSPAAPPPEGARGRAQPPPNFRAGAGRPPARAAEASAPPPPPPPLPGRGLSAAQRLRLAQICDTTLPTGGFAHSGGIEASLQLGLLVDARGAPSEAQLVAAAAAAVRSVARLQGPFAAAAHAAVAAALVAEAEVGAAPRAADAAVGHVAALSAQLGAMLVATPPAARASQQQASGLLRAVASWLDTSGEHRIPWAPHVAAARLLPPPHATGLPPPPSLPHAAASLAVALRRVQGELHGAPTLGAACALLELPAEAALDALVYSSTRDLFSAAVRLGLVGPLRAVALQADVASATTDEVAAAAALGCEVAAGTAPLMDAAHACHDLFQRRMFQS